MIARSSGCILVRTLDRRTVKITDGAIRNGYIPFARIRDFVPNTAIGGARKPSAAMRPLTFIFGGRSFRSDIVGGRKWILRNRSGTRAFFALSKVRAGDTVVIDKLAEDVFAFHLQRKSSA